MSAGSGGRFGTGFFIGALLGASVAMLIAPERGEERQDALLGGAREARSRVNDFYARGARIIEAARAELDAAVNEGRAAAEAQRIQLEQEARHTPERA